MTATHESQTENGLLERILARVESIDKNVEEILDQLSDHFADARYDGWRSEPYAGHDGYD